MPILVQKYGGSSVADIEKLKRVAQKIVETRRKGYDLVVVVSAMGDTTDDLLDMTRQLASNPSRRELDMLLSVGERISMALLSMAIHQEGVEATSLTGSQCGIITTASHSNARIMDVRPFRVQDELERGAVVIVAGYQGTSYKRDVTTLGRGGSDTTAVALAAALGAEACEIYSDVDGIFSADPRVVLNAQQLQSLSYDEMLELARSGAKVLNAEAVRFAQQANIALYARSTHLPNSKGTVIRPDGFELRAQHAEEGRMPMAASHINQGFLLRVDGDTVASVFDAIGDMELVSWQMSATTGQAFISVENMPDPTSWCAQLIQNHPEVSVETFGMVSLVGVGVGHCPKWMLALGGVLAQNDIEVEAQFISASRLSWVIASDDVVRAVRLVHDWSAR